jgi:hypothetical protein
LYTKEEIISSYPELEPYIKRDVTKDLKILEKWKNIFLDTTKDMQLKSFVEYNFGEI